MSRISRSYHDKFVAFSKVLQKYTLAIEKLILSRSYQQLPDKGPFTLDLIYTFINQFHVPFVHSREGAWSDNPKDSGGATMRGITLSTFRRKFKTLYDPQVYGILDPEYISLYNDVINSPYKTDSVVGKDALKTILTPKNNMRPFLATYYCTDNVKGLQLATYDPYLAFLIVDKTWMSGGYAWSNNISNGSIYSAAKEHGFTGSTPHYSTNQFMSWVSSLSSQPVGTNPFSTSLIQAFVNHANGIASKHKSQSTFLNGWLSRFVGSSKDKRPNHVSVGNKWIEYIITLL